LTAFENEAAADSMNGEATFYDNLSDDSSGSLNSYFSDKHVLRPRVVKTVCLSEYFRDKNVSNTIVKVDVEGAGSRVWCGLKASIDKVAYLIIEMLSPEIRDELPSKIIQEKRWNAYYIRDFDLVESKNGEFNYVVPFWNWLFCSLDSTALAKRLNGTKFRIIPALAG
jgi:hypothetical protein